MAVTLRTRRLQSRQTKQTEPGEPPRTAAAPAMPGWHKWVILVGLITSAILEVMDTTIVNVALPRMSGNFGATPDEIAWVFTGYILKRVSAGPNRL